MVLFQIEIEHKVCQKKEFRQEYIELPKTIKKIILYLLSQSIIPHKEYLFIYYLFEPFEFETDPNATSLLEFFQEDIKKLSWDSEDKFTENYIILLLEILNGNKKNALKSFVKNILLTNIHRGQEGLHCKFIEQFSSTIEDFDIDLVLEAFEFYFEPKIYFSLSLNEKKSLFAWGYELLINSSKFTKNLKTKRLYPHLKKIISLHIDNHDIEELMYAEFFAMISQFTLYQDPKELEKFNKEITYPCSVIYYTFSKDNYLPQVEEYNNKKKKIAFVFERLVEHTPFKVTLDLLKQLQKNKKFTDRYEITVYSLNYLLPLYNTNEIEKSITDLGIKVEYPISTYLELDNYSNRVQRAIDIRNHFIQNKIDIMIACFSSHDILNFLFATRTTPTQIYWSHGNGLYDVPGIDKRISHFTQLNTHFEFEVFTSPIDMEKYNPTVDTKLVQEIRAQYPKDAFILGTIGRLIKVDSKEYLQVVAKIMKENPKTIYLACGSGNQANIKEMIKELGIEDRFYFTGQIDSHIYGHVIDLWLDTFPFHQGESRREYVAKGNASVKLWKTPQIKNKKIEEIKKSDTLLIYVEGLDAQKYQKYIASNEWFNSMKCIFITSQAILQSNEIQTINLSHKDAHKYADLVFGIEDSRLICTHHNFIRKKITNILPLSMRPEDFYTNNIYNNELYFYKKRCLIAVMEVFNKEEYIEMANEFINDKILFEKMQLAMASYYKELALNNHEEFSKDFIKYIDVS